MNSQATPQWWNTLTDDDRVEKLGIRWHEPDAWEPPSKAASAAGTLRTEATMELDASNRQGKVRVATGPAVAADDGADIPVAWYLDPGQPDTLWCALADFYDPRLWIPVDPEPDALAETLSASHPRPRLNSLTLSSGVRAFLGFRDEVLLPHAHDEQLVALNGPDLDRYASGMGYLEPSSWASIHVDDPRDDANPKFADEHNTKTQLYGRIPSMTWRSRHSRSYVSFEIHGRELVCVNVRYRPSPKSHRAVVERLNAAFDIGYPIDLPLDVVGALSCLDFMVEDDLRHHLEQPESTDHLVSAIRVYAALWHGDLRASLRLREFAVHPEREVRSTVVRIAAEYDYRFLYEEVALAGGEDDPVEHLENLLLTGSGPDNYNAFGEQFTRVPVMVDQQGNAVRVHTDYIGDADIEDEDDTEPKDPE